ncbi:hypothetical protein CMUS01_12441 [Colletotrichum musicola]|uniref:Regulatory P domain-containing protein n=2 Tax=Colletotrichum orchidearum species complex TaxID=2707337 RepID=A0A8H6JMK0_9PEZI|nr:hypothetical protein CMUS01_12441 [Colletotrichum musicola]KAF6823172.1 hypothetical protein CPLU01_11542 [Colletotrichum plurivorum]
MKATTLATFALSALLHGASAKEIAPSELVSEIYDSGVIHKDLMARKKASWDRQIESGEMDSTAYRSRLASEGSVPCVDGVAAVVAGDPNNTFKCDKIDFYDFKSHADLGSRAGQGSSSWGWTSPDGREIAIIAQADGAAFAEITKEGKLVYLGRLPQYSTESIWRELRGYKNFVVIGSEASRHGVQIFDLNKVLEIDPANPKTFDAKADLTGYWNGLPAGSTHNIVINEEKQYAVAVGAQPRSSACKSGLIFIDLTDPANPTSPGCAADDGYVHDAQCLVYRGPDEKYFGRDICYGYNEDTLTIYDVTEKNTTKIISRTSYEGASYTHQGWVTNTEWQEFLVLDDEYDEVDATGPAASGYPITYFWDIRSLEKPLQTGHFKSPAYGIDHNQFVIDGLAYQSHYGAGLRIIDVSSLPQDPTGKLVKEVGFFDVYPENDNEPNGGSIDFVGTWSHYPYFKSGHILVNTIERGAFVVKRSA